MAREKSIIYVIPARSNDNGQHINRVLCILLSGKGGFVAVNLTFSVIELITAASVAYRDDGLNCSCFNNKKVSEGSGIVLIIYRTKIE